MKCLALCIANANHQLDSYLDQFEYECQLADSYATPLLKPKSRINVVFNSSCTRNIIPESGIGGYTYRSDFFTITINDKKELLDGTMFATICHEMTHAVRWQRNSA